MGKSACFTGHRSLTGNTADLDKRLYNALERAITKENITEYYTGGALARDTLSAQTVLKLRKLYPEIKLHLILPCSNNEQTARWSEEHRTEFYRILSLADTTEYTSKYYYKGCMKIRNTRLVELADYCFCFLDTNQIKSGTAQTVRMALKKGIPVINFYKAANN